MIQEMQHQSGGDRGGVGGETGPDFDLMFGTGDDEEPLARNSMTIQEKQSLANHVVDEYIYDASNEPHVVLQDIRESIKFSNQVMDDGVG